MGGVLFSRFLCFFIAAIIIGMAPAAAVGATCDPKVATAVSVQGTVDFRLAGGGDWESVQLGDGFCPGDEIRVLDNSRASLALANESVLRLNANSSIVIQKFEEKTSFVDLFKGAAHLFARKPNKLEVNTPYVVAGVRGTEFLIRVEDNQTFISVFEGERRSEAPIGCFIATAVAGIRCAPRFRLRRRIQCCSRFEGTAACFEAPDWSWCVALERLSDILARLAHFGRDRGSPGHSQRSVCFPDRSVPEAAFPETSYPRAAFPFSPNRSG